MALWVIAWWTPRTRSATLATTGGGLPTASDPAAQDTAQGTVPGLRFRQPYHFVRSLALFPTLGEFPPPAASFETITTPIRGARLRQPYAFPRLFYAQNRPALDTSVPGPVSGADIYVPILRRRRR